VITVMSNPRQYKIPDWFLNRQKDIKDGKYTQALSNVLDSKIREDLERLKKIRAHRGLRHYWGYAVLLCHCLVSFPMLCSDPFRFLVMCMCMCIHRHELHRRRFLAASSRLLHSMLGCEFSDLTGWCSTTWCEGGLHLSVGEPLGSSWHPGWIS